MFPYFYKLTPIGIFMIKVGINENVVLKESSISEKGHLLLNWKELGAAANVDTSNPFEVAASGDTIDASTDAKLMVMSLLVPKETDQKGAELTRPQRASRVTNDLQELMNKLKHILAAYTTNDVISKAFADIYAGTGFTVALYNEKGAECYHDLLLDKTRLDVVSKNVFEAFLSVITPFLDKDDLPMRLKLVRQSAEKHYATLPGAKFLSSYPFLESMSIPAEATKLKFSDYEIKNKLNDGTPVAQTQADATPAAPVSAHPFGQR